MSYTVFFITFSLILGSCQPNPTKPKANNRLDCTGTDIPLACYFDQIPQNITSHIIKQAEGSKLRLETTIYTPSGKPFPNVLVYFYQTNHRGFYEGGVTGEGVNVKHGAIYGWVKTDPNGQFTIQTIRPLPYPNDTIPAHIHGVIKTPDGKIQYFSDYVFADDPLVNEQYLSGLKRWNLLGGTGVINLEKDGDTWKGKRLIQF